MSKSVSFGRPTPKKQPAADDWVAGGGGESAASAKPEPAEVVPMKRLTLDIPADLHRRVKAGCANRGEKIVDVVRRFLDAEFPRS